MCGSSLEASTMPRSFLVKKNQNYSHCPLKKRPLSYFLQESLEAESVAATGTLFSFKEKKTLILVYVTTQCRLK